MQEPAIKCIVHLILIQGRKVGKFIGNMGPLKAKNSTGSPECGI